MFGSGRIATYYMGGGGAGGGAPTDTSWTLSAATNTYFPRLFVNAQDSNPQDIWIGDSGTKLYVLGNGNDRVYQYTLGTAWTVQGGTYASKSLIISGQENNSTAMALSSDGTKCYVVGNTNKTVYQYTLSTAWDISTGTYASKSFSVNTQETTPTGIYFKSDGTKMYVVGQTADSVFQYSLSTAWDISTASYDSVSVSISATTTTATSLRFNSTGTKMYVLNDSNDRVNQYNLSTAWVVSSATYASKFTSVSYLEGTTTGIHFSDAGDKFYSIGTNNARVVEYAMSTTDDISTVESTTSDFALIQVDASLTALHFSPDGTKCYIASNTNNRIWQHSLSSAWDLNTIVYDNKQLLAGTQGTGVTGVFLSTDGTKLYHVGTGNDTVWQYTLSTAWDLATATYASKSFSVTGQEANPSDIFFKDDGTKMYMIGTTNRTVYQYTLSTAWDISTASYDSKSFSVSAQETSPAGIFFKSDGTKMFQLGNGSDVMTQYSLSTAWDVSTASYDSVSVSVSARDGQMHGIAFKSDGTRAYTLANLTKTIYAWNLV